MWAFNPSTGPASRGAFCFAVPFHLNATVLELGRHFPIVLHMKKLIFAFIFVATGAIATVSWSQTQSPTNPNRKIYFSTPLEHSETVLVELATANVPPHGGSNFHTHPGDQWEAVQEGEVTLEMKGEPPRLLKTGESAYIPRGVVHRNRNLTDRPARTIELNIVDKGKPGITAVND
jgi:quercetin dioxygenase-like cupin family protein